MLAEPPDAIASPAPAPLWMDWPGPPAGSANTLTSVRSLTAPEAARAADLEAARPGRGSPPVRTLSVGLGPTTVLLRSASRHAAAWAEVAFLPGAGRAAALVEVEPGEPPRLLLAPGRALLRGTSLFADLLAALVALVPARHGVVARGAGGGAVLAWVETAEQAGLLAAHALASGAEVAAAGALLEGPEGLLPLMRAVPVPVAEAAASAALVPLLLDGPLENVGDVGGAHVRALGERLATLARAVLALPGEAGVSFRNREQAELEDLLARLLCSRSARALLRLDLPKRPSPLPVPERVLAAPPPHAFLEALA